MISGLAAAAVSNDAEALFSDGMWGLDTNITLSSDCLEDTLEPIIEQGMCL